MNMSSTVDFVEEDEADEREGGCHMLLTFDSSPVVFHKIEEVEEEEGEPKDESDENTTTTTVVYLTQEDCSSSLNEEGEDDGDTQFDDEHARAVRNLLEFHNQQTKFSSIVDDECEQEDNDEEMEGSTNSTMILVGGPLGEFSASGEQLISNDDIPTYSGPSERKHSQPLMYGNRNKTVGCNNSNKLSKTSSTTASCSAPPLTYGGAVVARKSTVDSQQHVEKKLMSSPTVLKEARAKGKRRTIIDKQKVIPIQEFKRQLVDTSDIVAASMDCAPPTKKAMNYLAFGGVGKYFAYSGRRSLSVPLAKLFFSRLTLTTEPRQSTSAGNFSTDDQITPLNAELKTPAIHNYGVGTKRSTILPCQFNDAVAKRAANSFDSFCKGMTKPTKLEFSARKIKPRGTEASKLSPRLVNGRHQECQSSIHPRILFVRNLQTANEVATLSIDSDNAFPEQHSITNHVGHHEHVIYSMEEGQLEVNKSETELVDSCEEEQLEISVAQDAAYGPNGPSNFEMLIAAAEQHNSLSTSETLGTSIDSTSIPMKIEILEEEGRGQTTNVQYNNIGEGEQLIVLSDNGESFRVTTSARGELTLWPHSDYDTNIFA